MANLLDSGANDNSAEYDLMVLHGPTWAVPYAWDDEEAEGIRDQCEREKDRWRFRPRGSVLHVMPAYLAGD